MYAIKCGLLLVLLFGIAYGLQVNRNCPDYAIESNFQVSDYLGVWYEVYRYEQEFQVSGDCVTAEYNANPDGSVEVLNSMAILPDTTVLSREGIAVLSYPELDPLPAMLNVSFDGTPDRSNYWVLSTDYENYSIVWSCFNMGLDLSTEFAWVLSRQPQLPEAVESTVNQLIDELLDRSNLRTTNQNKIDCLGSEIEPY